MSVAVRKNRVMRPAHPVDDAAAAVARLLIRWTRAVLRWLGGRRRPSRGEQAPALPAPASAAQARAIGPGQPSRLPAQVPLLASSAAANGCSPLPGHHTPVEGTGATSHDPVPAVGRGAPPLPFEAVPCLDAFPWPLVAGSAATEPDISAGAAPAAAVDPATVWAAALIHPSDPLLAPPPPAAWTVSVVLVNEGATIPAGAVGSVLRQSYPAWELLLVATADGPPASVSMGDPRVRLLLAPGADDPTARALALAAASGMFVAYLGAAERMAPGWLASVVATLADLPAADVVVGERIALAGDLDLALDLPAATQADLAQRCIDRVASLSTVAHRRNALGAWLPTDDPASQLALLTSTQAHRRICVAAVVEPLVDLRPSRCPHDMEQPSSDGDLRRGGGMPVPTHPA